MTLMRESALNEKFGMKPGDFKDNFKKLKKKEGLYYSVTMRYT